MPQAARVTWSSTDARVRRPWVAAAAALVAAVLLAPVGGWSGCAGGADGCVERTRLLVGPDVPTSWHAPVLVLGALVAGLVAWSLLTVVARRAARRERL